MRSSEISWKNNLMRYYKGEIKTKPKPPAHILRFNPSYATMLIENTENYVKQMVEEYKDIPYTF